MATRVRLVLVLIVLLCLAMPARATPDNGWWWNPAENGRGFFLEWQGDQLFVAGYFYADDGRPTWMFSGGAMSGPQAYSGTLYSVSGGQTLMGNYVAPATFSNVGVLSLDFTHQDAGTLTWPGGAIPIQRHVFANGEAGFQPTGWWWNPDESGRGFSIEVQGDTLFMAGFMYDGAGNPVWYFSSGKLATPQRYRGTLLRATGGQTISGPYRPPAAIVPAGQVSIEFASEETATMTVSDQPPATMAAAASAAGDRAMPADEDLAPLVGRRIDLRRQMQVRDRLRVTPDSWKGTLRKLYEIPHLNGRARVSVDVQNAIFRRRTPASVFPADYVLVMAEAEINFELRYADPSGTCELLGRTTYDVSLGGGYVLLNAFGHYIGRSTDDDGAWLGLSGTCAGHPMTLPSQPVLTDLEIGPADLFRGMMEGRNDRSGSGYKLIYEWRLIPYAD